MEAVEEYVELTIVVERPIVDWLTSLVPQYQEQFGDDFDVSGAAGAELQSLYCLCEVYAARDADALQEAILERGVNIGADVGMSTTLEVLGIRKAEKGVA